MPYDERSTPDNKIGEATTIDQLKEAVVGTALEGKADLIDHYVEEAKDGRFNFDVTAHEIMETMSITGPDAYSLCDKLISLLKSEYGKGEK